MKWNTPWVWIIGVIVILLIWGASSYNSLVQQNQAVSAAWAQIQADYQRRADLVPNLVSVVKGAANFEQSTLMAVTNARTKAEGTTIDAANLTPEKLAAFNASQNELSGALTHFFAVAESYPTLTATQSYRDLQSQLEGTENRITVARRDFNTAVQAYDASVQSFPTMIFAKLFGFGVKPYFEATAGSDTVPAVNL